MSGAPLEAAIVDRRPVMRRGVQTVRTDAGFAVSAAVAETGELADPEELDVVLLGPDDVACRLIDAVAALRGVTRVLLICAPVDAAHLIAAVRAGASGYVTERADDTVIQAAAHCVAAGGFTVSAELTEVVLTELCALRPAAVVPRRHGGGSALSPRQYEALRWIARGLTHAQTATRMRVGKPTVDT